MEIKITQERENPLLNRREIKFTVSHKGSPTPTRDAVKEKLAALLNSQINLVIIEEMKPKFGRQEAEGYAKIYETEERARAVEREYIIQRNIPKEETQEEAEEEAKEEEAEEEAKEETGGEE